MDERLIAITLYKAAVAATDAVSGVEIPFDATIVGASFSLDVVTGTPTSVDIDINDDGTAITGYAAVNCGATAGVITVKKSTHFGGTVAVQRIAAGSEIDFDIAFTAGSTPTAGLTIVLYLLVGSH